MAAADFGILAVAADLPRRRATARELSAAFGFDADAVDAKLGLREKCIAVDDDEHPADFCERAARRALRALGADPSDVGLVIFTGVTRDYVPSYCVSVEVVWRLGMTRALAYDLTLGCAAPILAIDQARRRGADGRPPLSLVVTAERWSDTLSPHVEFPLAWLAHADGGAAMVLGPGAGVVVGEAAVHMRPDFNHFLIVPAGGTREPASAATLAGHRHARRIFAPPPVDVVEAYITGYRAAVSEALERSQRSMESMDLLLMNQIRPEMRAKVRAALGLTPTSDLDCYPWLGHLGGADTLVALEVATRRGCLPLQGTLVMAASSVTAFAAVCADVRHGPIVAAAVDASIPASVVELR
jgi:3-oxoacyl-[acyl-carrier-protein] synthase III